MGIFIAFMLIMKIGGEANGEYFSAMSQIPELFNIENSAISFLRQQLQKEEHNLAHLKQILKEYSHEYENGYNDMEKYLSNPIKAYLLLKNFISGWANLEDVIMGNTKSLEIQNFAHFEKISKFPVDGELGGVADGLNRLKDIYKVSVSEFTKDSFDAEDYYEVGRRLFDKRDYADCIPWLQESLLKLLGKADDESMSLQMNIFERMAVSHYELGNVLEALNMTNNILYYNPKHQKALQNRAMCYEKLEEISKKENAEEDVSETTIPSHNTDEYMDEIYDSFKKLCREGETFPPETRKFLKCRYIDHGIPHLKLAPFKQEEILLDPKIYLYHDVINDKEIEVIKNISSQRLERSLVTSFGVDYSRISKTAWLEDDDHQVIKDISVKFEQITHMTLSTSEHLQVVNYGVAGYYGPHRDAMEADLDNTGDRMSTILLYLNDVEKGGGTVFPFLDVGVLPKKGLAIQWFNVHPNGDVDDRLWHASCPTYNGSKWIANKWLHERGQEFLKPCSFDKHKLYE